MYRDYRLEFIYVTTKSVTLIIIVYHLRERTHTSATATEIITNYALQHVLISFERRGMRCQRIAVFRKKQLEPNVWGETFGVINFSTSPIRVLITDQYNINRLF